MIGSLISCEETSSFPFIRVLYLQFCFYSLTTNLPYLTPTRGLVCIAAVNPAREGGRGGDRGGGEGADLIDRTFGNLVGKCRMEKEEREKANPIDGEEGNTE